MKTEVFLGFICLSLFLSACSGDDDAEPAAKLNHVGEKWTISSVEYTIVDQSLSNPALWVKSGTASNAGAFYFNGTEGSFDIIIDKKHYEDYFSYTEDETGITIISVDQSVSSSQFSQNVISISGDTDGTTMTLSGSFVNQNMAQQFSFTGSFVLTKQ